MKLKVLLRKLEASNESSQLNKQRTLVYGAASNNFLDLYQTTMATPKTRSTRFSEVHVSDSDLIFDLEIKGRNDVVATKSNSLTLNSTAMLNDSMKFSGRLSSPSVSSFRCNLTILQLKSSLCQKMKVTLDSLEFFDFSNKELRVNDASEVDNFIHSKTMSYSLVVFYYSISKKQTIVEIEYFQNNIDKIIFELSLECSIYTLKHMLAKKLQSESPISEFLIYYSSSGNNKDVENSDTNLSSDIKDNMCIGDVLKENDNEDAKYLHLLLIRKTKKKYSIGLDLSFTFMRNLKKVNFDETAPSHREVSDGMNIFFYCINKKCGLYEDFFTRNFGFDQFDVMSEIEKTKCPFCKNKTPANLEARCIGFINAEWNYKGVLSNKSTSLVSGDGVTIDNKLYVIKDTNINLQFLKLDILVKQTKFKLKKLKTIDQHPGDSGDEDLNDIDLQDINGDLLMPEDFKEEEIKQKKLMPQRTESIIKFVGNSPVEEQMKCYNFSSFGLNGIEEIKMESRSESCCFKNGSKGGSFCSIF